MSKAEEFSSRQVPFSHYELIRTVETDGPTRRDLFEVACLPLLTFGNARKAATKSWAEVKVRTVSSKRGPVKRFVPATGMCPYCPRANSTWRCRTWPGKLAMPGSLKSLPNKGCVGSVTLTYRSRSWVTRQGVSMPDVRTPTALCPLPRRPRRTACQSIARPVERCGSGVIPGNNDPFVSPFGRERFHLLQQPLAGRGFLLRGPFSRMKTAVFVGGDP